jgi:flagellar motor switch protein FliG
MKKNSFINRHKQPTSLGGVETAAKIMSLMKMDMANTIIGDIAEKDEKLAIEIQENMFLFDSLANINDRSIQKMLQKTPNDQLAVALKNTNKIVQDKFYKNMSKRAKKRLIDDMEMLGDLRASDIELAQKNITRTARRMADAGEIILEINRQDFL